MLQTTHKKSKLKAYEKENEEKCIVLGGLSSFHNVLYASCRCTWFNKPKDIFVFRKRLLQNIEASKWSWWYFNFWL